MEVPIISKGGASVMNEFEHVTGYLREYLSQNQYCSSLISANERCFRLLGEYLDGKEVDYSPDEADKWLAICNTLVADSTKAIFHMTIIRLRDIYEHGSVCPEHDTKHHQSYNALCEDWRSVLDAYLNDLTKSLSPKTVEGHKFRCSQFLIFLQNRDITCVDEISFDMLLAYYDEGRPPSINAKHDSNSKLSSLLTYFYKHGLVPYGFSILVHYLAVGNKQGCYWNTISESAHTRIAEMVATQHTTDTETLKSYKDAVMALHKQNSYSKAVMATYNRAADLLILFLEMNGYKYSPEIATVWFEETKSVFGTEADAIHRSLCMIADYHRESVIHLEKIYRNSLSAFAALPEWCAKPARAYVDTKIREGWERSTLDMIRSSISRFCRYLDDIGVRSFMELNASHIKQFHANDVHKTPHGKNAYNVRIRKFLIYLGENGLLANPMLFVSLPRTSAPKETIVVVLTEEEMDELNEQLNKKDSLLSLRGKAMLLLGLKMGMRASDIVNLKIDDVDWDAAVIRFVQKKTSVEVSLPMPTTVGNALFRYITEERFQNKDASIFLTEKAPHRSLGRAMCQKTIVTALPDRHVEGSGFHVTRKTYATNLLKKGVGAGMVAEALGQRGTTSVHRYLSLDVERMRMCPIPLDEFGIRGWHHA